LDRLIQDPNLRKSMGTQSKVVISNDHNVEKNAKRLLHLLKTVIDKAGYP